MNWMRTLFHAALAAISALLLVACRSADAPRSTPMNTPTAMPPATSTPTLQSPSGQAANADVTYVRAVQTDADTWTFHVTVEHPDTGWEDYVDGWDVLTPEGTVLKPDPESPFTRLPSTRTSTSSPLPAVRAVSSSPRA
jgi:hypothetical protein